MTFLDSLSGAVRPQPGAQSAGAFAYRNFFAAHVDGLKAAGNYRTFARLSRIPGAWPRALYHDPSGAHEVTVWCSNDYLGMGQHPIVTAAMAETARAQSAGAGGTRNIAGTHRILSDLEATLARLHDKDAALLFTSGYLANVGTLSVIASRLPNCVVFSDADNHASMISGIRSARVEKRIFEHNNMAQLEAQLRELPLPQPKIIACESVYSMDGSIGDLKSVTALAKRYGALTFVDEVHAVGLYGARGAGMANALGVAADVDIIQGTLAKAFGVVGGYIATSADIVDFVRSFCGEFIFTTAIPPPVAAAALAAVTHVGDREDLRARQQDRVGRVKSALVRRGLPVLVSSTHIVPVMVGDAHKVRAATDALLAQHSIYVQPINAPTVSTGTERIRITPGPLHTDEMIEHLAESLRQVFVEQGLVP